MGDRVRIDAELGGDRLDGVAGDEEAGGVELTRGKDGGGSGFVLRRRDRGVAGFGRFGQILAGLGRVKGIR